MVQHHSRTYWSSYLFMFKCLTESQRLWAEACGWEFMAFVGETKVIWQGLCKANLDTREIRFYLWKDTSESKWSND